MPYRRFSLKACWLLVVLLSLSTDRCHSEPDQLGCVLEPAGTKQRCFFYHSEPTSWPEALDKCRTQDGLLAVLDSPEVEDEVVGGLTELLGNIGHASEARKSWIGGHSSHSQGWTWSNSSSNDEEEIQFIHAPSSTDQCGAVISHSQSSQDRDATTISLIGKHCREKHHFICQGPSSSDQPHHENQTETYKSCQLGPYPGVMVSGACYVFYGNDPDNFRQSWNKALLSCAGLGEGVRLASGRDLTPEAMKRIVSGASGYYWLYLTRQKWFWTHVYNKESDTVQGPEMVYTNWYANPPAVHTDGEEGAESTDCIAVNQYPFSREGWTDERCTEQLAYICQKELEITTIAMTTEPGSKSRYISSDKLGPRHQNNEEDYYMLRDWANVIIPCAMISLIALAAILSVYCYFQQKRKDYIAKS